MNRQIAVTLEFPTWRSFITKNIIYCKLIREFFCPFIKRYSHKYIIFFATAEHKRYFCFFQGVSQNFCSILYDWCDICTPGNHINFFWHTCLFLKRNIPVWMVVKSTNLLMQINYIPKHKGIKMLTYFLPCRKHGIGQYNLSTNKQYKSSKEEVCTCVELFSINYSW